MSISRVSKYSTEDKQKIVECIKTGMTAKQTLDSLGLDSKDKRLNSLYYSLKRKLKDNNEIPDLSEKKNVEVSKDIKKKKVQTISKKDTSSKGSTRKSNTRKSSTKLEESPQAISSSSKNSSANNTDKKWIQIQKEVEIRKVDVSVKDDIRNYFKNNKRGS